MIPVEVYFPTVLHFPTPQCASSQPDPGSDKCHDNLAMHIPPLSVNGQGESVGTSPSELPVTWKW